MFDFTYKVLVALSKSPDVQKTWMASMYFKQYL